MAPGAEAGSVGDDSAVLEFDRVARLLAGYTVSEPGREQALALAPLATASAVEDALAEAAEMEAVMAESGAPPVGGCRDLCPALAQLQIEGTWLAPLALLDVLAAIEAAAACRRFLAGREGQPLLAAIAGELDPLRELGAALRESIGPRGEILAQASFELGEIRHDIAVLRQRLRRVLEEMLTAEKYAGVFQDQLVTERNGRYVLPVRADHRGRIKGFVHDESASGQTLFVEPAVVLEKNNELQHLQRAEKREEERILRRLAAAVRQAASVLAANQQLLARLDLRAAVARYAGLCRAIAPRLSAAPGLLLREARHPLLLLDPDGRRRASEPVAIDILLPAECATLVVSGPNTGGKTVALKTAGLLVQMVRAGLPIPCHPDSSVHLFGRVFADIGDEQSIEQSLSTFSGHLVRLGRILAAADSDALVLLDELGTGTDPSEGGALALAVIDLLRERGAKVMVTTHLNLVKGYAQLRDDVTNAAVEFDRRTLAPAYRLHYGIPGASNAFTIARRLGLPAELLERAEGYLDGGERQGLQVMEELNRLRQQAEHDAAVAARLRDEARRERDRRRQLLCEFEDQRRTLHERAVKRAEQLVREAEGRLRGLFSQAESAGSGEGTARERARLAGELATIRQAARQAAPEPLKPPTPPRETRPGELLRIPALGSEGEVVRVQGDEVELNVAGKKLRAPLTALEAFAPRRFASPRRPARVRGATEERSFQPRLLLIGKRVDEALALLERYLDDALLAGFSEVEVVHGSGEGILRRAVREALGRAPAVRAFRPGDPGRGGDNVTLVEVGPP